MECNRPVSPATSVPDGARYENHRFVHRSEPPVAMQLSSPPWPGRSRELNVWQMAKRSHVKSIYLNCFA